MVLTTSFKIGVLMRVIKGVDLCGLCTSQDMTLVWILMLLMGHVKFLKPRRGSFVAALFWFKWEVCQRVSINNISLGHHVVFGAYPMEGLLILHNLAEG